MSRTNIRRIQQQIVPSGSPSNPIPQGNCFLRPQIFPNPGPLYYDGQEEHNYIFTLPNTSNPLGIRIDDTNETTQLEGETILNQLGISITEHKDNFPYRVRFPLLTNAQSIDGDQELRISPTYNRFPNNIIAPPSITLNIETAIDTSRDTDGELWQEFLNIQIDPSSGITTDTTNTPIRQVGVDFSSIVSPTTYSNATKILGEPLVKDFSGWDYSPQLEDDIPDIFKGGSYPSKPNESILDEITNPKTSTRIIYRYALNPGSIPLLFVIRIVHFSVTFDGSKKLVANIQQARTQIPINLLTTDLKVNLYDGERRVNSIDWPIQKIEGRLSRDFPITSPVNNIGIAVREGLSVIRSIDTELPRKFTNTAETAYIIKSPQQLDNFGIFAQGPEINVPNNSEIAVVNNDGNNHAHLRYVGEWDGITFKKERVRCPSWMIYWVLTDPSFGLGLSNRDINLQSFYDASVYNNELVNNYPRWMFDGLLQGTTKEIINILLTCMNGALEKDHLGIWTLYQERPQKTSWLISPCVCNGATITNRLAVEKPRVRASYINRFNGKEETILESALTDVVEEYPGQEKICAERWSYWKSFLQQDLLNTVEFILPLSSNNNDGPIIDFYKMEMYDIIEVYDPDFSGQRASGRILESTRTSIKVDEIPTDIFPSSIVPDALSELRIQKKDGGIEKIRMTRVDPDDNMIFFEDREPFVVGNVWAIKLGRFNPRKWRVLSISENDQGTAIRVVARFYVDGMHDFVDNFIPVVYPPLLAYLLRIDQYIWDGECGPNIETFRGAMGAIHFNYPVAFDQINDRMLFDWGDENWDDHYGTMNNLIDSCTLQRNSL